MAKGIEQLLKDEDFNTSNATVGIFTDSHGLCDHLMRLKRQDVPVEVHTQNLIQELIKLDETNPERVTIHWIPSHRGIGDNERADKQAEKGHKSKEVAVIPFTRQWIKTNLMGRPMLHFYEHLKANVRPSELVPSYPDREHFKIPRNKKSSTLVYGGQSLFHIQTGHTFLRSHQYLVNKKVKDNVCSWCEQAKETPEHVLLHCQK